jgi:peptidoglycan LD-endopeptidase LytH
VTVRVHARGLATLVALALVWVSVGEVASAQSLGEIRGQLERVRDEVASIQDRMDVTQARLEELYARQVALEDERDRLQRELDAHAIEITRLEDRVAQRLRETFKHGATLDPVAVFFASEDAPGALARAETVRRLVDADTASTEALVAARIRAAAAEDALVARTAELEAASREVEGLLEGLVGDLDAAQRLESSLTERERAELARIERERREAAARAAAAARSRAAEAETQALAAGASGAMVCPIDRPHSFIDSWGHPRSGGRRHRGTDMMAPHGLAVRAITDGVWEHRRPGASAGIWGVLRAPNGDAYWYLHLSAHTAPNGARVSAGQQVGRNGSTGNASTPHLHFEQHPGGGAAINPYPLLRSLC